MNITLANIDIFILAAGFGTRLRPLTDTCPKPLIKIAGKTLLERNIESLVRSGAKRIIVNVHYLAEQIISFLGNGSKWGIEIVISREDPILDTGGGIKKIENILQHDILLTMNSDILLPDDFDFIPLLETHNSYQDTLSTLILRADADSKKYGEIGIGDDSRIYSFLNVQSADIIGKKIDNYMYTGIQFINRQAFSIMPAVGTVFSITRDFYAPLLSQQYELRGIVYSGYWSDVGTLESLANAQKEFLFR